MRIYYIFSIKENLLNAAKLNEEGLYNIFEGIYLKNSNQTKAYNLVKNIVNPLEKENISKRIKEINEDNINYTNYLSMHSINNYFSNEISKITINNFYMLLKTNVENPSFFNDIKNIKNLFCCDFINMDYFFLEKIFSCKKNR